MFMLKMCIIYEQKYFVMYKIQICCFSIDTFSGFRDSGFGQMSYTINCFFGDF